jgi:hypothetical protein
MAGLADHDSAADELSTVRGAMLDMVTGCRTSQITRTAAALSLAEHCSDGPVTAEQLARLESADVTATERFLRGCVAVGLLSCADGLRFTATPLLASLHREASGSLRGLALSRPARGHWLPWGQLLEPVQTCTHPERR